MNELDRAELKYRGDGRTELYSFFVRCRRTYVLQIQFNLYYDFYIHLYKALFKIIPLLEILLFCKKENCDDRMIPPFI